VKKRGRKKGKNEDKSKGRGEMKKREAEMKR
jgi:hypothetical protein